MTDQRSAAMTWLAFIVAAVVLAGSLWLSVGMNLKACPLCFYQRTFIMGIVAVLAIGLIARVGSPALLSLLSLPMGFAAMGVAAFHVWLELAGRLECPAGVFGLGSAPQQSLTGLTLTAVILAADVLRNRAGMKSAAGSFIAGIVIGGALAWFAIISSPPLPGPPAAPHDKPPDVCRPPYQPQ